jgi:energy-coupling factor transport system ATP-binding protein
MTIELDHVSFNYPDGSPAVEDVSLTIGDGEAVAIIGQNGAGKTTSVKLMNGLLKPTSGTVTIDGIPTTDRTTATVARDVGYVFQNPDDQIFASTVRDELEYMPKYFKWDEDKREDRVLRAARLTGIEEHLDTNPNDLPFAIKKFVAMAAILVGDCRYVILDEPTAGLDLIGLKILRALIEQLNSEGIAVVTITHDMRFVVETFDRVVVMANRRVVTDGTTEHVFSSDTTLTAARLRRPEAAQLARDLGLGDDALRIDDIAARLR